MGVWPMGYEIDIVTEITPTPIPMCFKFPYARFYSSDFFEISFIDGFPLWDDIEFLWFSGIAIVLKIPINRDMNNNRRLIFISIPEDTTGNALQSVIMNVYMHKSIEFLNSQIMNIHKKRP